MKDLDPAYISGELDATIRQAIRSGAPIEVHYYQLAALGVRALLAIAHAINKHTDSTVFYWPEGGEDAD